MLLTDCHMPNLDGYELTAAIRDNEDEIDDRFPIVAITANALQGEVERCLAAGMDDYLSKPLEMDKLKLTLKKWMPAMPDANIAPVPSDSTEKPANAPSPVTTEPAAEGDETLGRTGSETNSGDEPIDPQALRAMFGDDDETFKEILQKFVEPASANVKEIEDAYERRSSIDVASAAHKLKSSSRSVGANELADLCLTLETAGKEDNWQDIDGAAPQLSKSLAEVIKFIN